MCLACYLPLVSVWQTPHFKHPYPCQLVLITEFPSGQGKSQATKLANYELAEWEKENYLNYLAVLNDWERQPPKEKANNPKPKSHTYMVSDGTIEAVTDKFILDEQRMFIGIRMKLGNFLMDIV